MAQDGTTAGGASYTLDNVTFPVARSKLQSILDAIRSTNKGNTAPDLIAGQFWIDDNTPSTTVWTLYFYDGTDSIQFATIDTTNNTVNFIDSTVVADIVTDLTPELGGDLSTNGNDINFGDNDKAQFGAGNDLQIYSDGSSSFIYETGAGNLYLKSNGNQIQFLDNSNSVGFSVDLDGATSLRHNLSQKLATTSTGIDVTGRITADGIDLGDNNTLRFGAGNDLTIFHDGVGGGSYINESGTGNLFIKGANIKFENSDSSKTYAFFTDGGAVELKYDNSTKLATTSTGVDVTGNVTATGNLTSLGIDDNATSTAITIDSSENVFIKPTGTGTNIGIDAVSTGFYLRDGGQFRAARDNSQPILANRLNGDGVIIDCRKDGTTVGSIGTVSSGNLVIEGDTSLRLHTDGQERLILDSTECIFNNASYDQDFRIESNNNSNMFFVDAGADSVGINTNSTQSTLYVNNDRADREGFRVIQSTNGRTTAGKALALIYDDLATSTQPALQVQQNGTGEIIIAKDGVTTAFVVKDGGNVGIGTGSPTYALDVESSGAYIAQFVGTGTSAFSQLTTTTHGTNNTDGFIFGIDSNGDSYIINRENASLRFLTNNQERARFTNGGRLGIGTTNPTHELMVAGGTDTRITVDGSNSSGFYLTDSGTDGVTIRNTTGNLETYNIIGKEIAFNQTGLDCDFRIESDANTHALFVQGNNGHIGMGTSTLPRSLNIYGASHGTIGLDNPATGSPQIAFKQAGTDKAYLSYWDAFDTLSLSDGSGNGLHFNPVTQRVGIGITSPGVALDVSGAIRATGDITAFYTSDRTLKTNIENISNPMDKIKELNGVSYNWTKEAQEKYNHLNDQKEIGVIAQEVEKVLPEMVAQREDGTKAVRYERMCALLIECVKDLQNQIDELKGK